VTERVTPSGTWRQQDDGSWVLARDVTPDHPASKRPEDFEPVLVDWFGPQAQGDPWVQIAGNGSSGWVYDPTAPTVAGVFNVTVASGQTSVVEWQGTTPLPFGLDDTYRVRIRVKAPDSPAFDGAISVGVLGYAFDGTTLIDELGTNDPLKGHAAIRRITGLSGAAIAGYSLFEGYISGRALSTVDLNVPADGTVSPWDNALKLSNLAYYWRPYFKVEGGTSTATISVDAIEVFRLDSNVVVPGTLETNVLTADSAFFTTLEATGATFPPTADDIAAGGPAGWVWTSDESGTGHWEASSSPVVVSTTEPASPTVGMLWLDPGPVDVEEFAVFVKATTTAATAFPGTAGWADYPSADTWTIDLPCNGVLYVDWALNIRIATAATLAAWSVSKVTAVGCTATPVWDESTSVVNQARAYSPTAMGNNSGTQRGWQQYVITGVDETVGASIELKHRYFNNGASNTFLWPMVVCRFVPRADTRVVTLTTGTP
jgi:hypothetical protein